MYDVLYKLIDISFIPIDMLFSIKIPLDKIGGGIRNTNETSIGDFTCVIIIVFCLVRFVLDLIDYKKGADV